MSRFLVFPFALFGLLLCVQAHGQVDKLDLKRFDAKKTEQMLLEAINTVRDTAGAPPLVADGILQRAAVSQAEYIVNEHQFTRFQDEEELKDVNARVYYFKGKHSVVEELLAFSNVKRTRTYQSLTRSILRRWFGSASYFDKIKSADFTHVGLSVAYDKKEDKVYAVQVLGDEPFTALDGFPVPEDLYGMEQLERGDLRKYCGDCTNALRDMERANVRYDLIREGNDIYFVMDDKQYFDQLFSNSRDGIAVDVVIKSQFRCGKPNVEMHPWAYKGLMLPPVYQSDLEAGKRASGPQFKVKVGTVPSIVADEKFELNLIIIQRRYKCHYENFFDPPSAEFGSLPPRMLLTDSATRFVKEVANPLADELKARRARKTARFDLFYENDRTNYKLKDLKVLFDSFNLAEYQILQMEITAYTPIEGETLDNMRDQDKRVTSIMEALQGLQEDSIPFKKQILEDYYGFFKSVAKTKHYKLADMASFEVKEQLKNKELREELEPILKQNRKISFWTVLEPREEPLGDVDFGSDAAPAGGGEEEKGLKKAFADLVKASDVQGVLDLQKSVFADIRAKKRKISILDSLALPDRPEFRVALEDRALFWNFMKPEAVKKAMGYYNDLARLFPEDSVYMHNSVALQMESWYQGDSSIAPYTLAEQVDALENRFYGAEEAMRLTVNLRLCQASKLSAIPDSLADYVYNNYASAGLLQEGAVNVSRFLCAADRPDKALVLIEPFASLETPNEEVIFQYLRLTLSDPKHTRLATYRAELQKAFEINPERFKKLFEWREAEGGVSFQLLDDKTLSKFYCENCAGEKKAN